MEKTKRQPLPSNKFVVIFSEKVLDVCDTTTSSEFFKSVGIHFINHKYREKKHVNNSKPICIALSRSKLTHLKYTYE